MFDSKIVYLHIKLLFILNSFFFNFKIISTKIYRQTAPHQLVTLLCLFKIEFFEVEFLNLESQVMTKMSKHLQTNGITEYDEQNKWIEFYRLK